MPFVIALLGAPHDLCPGHHGPKAPLCGKGRTVENDITISYFVKLEIVPVFAIYWQLDVTILHMVDEMKNPDSKSEARQLLQRVHPDKFSQMAPQYVPLVDKLIPLLDKVMKNPHDLDNWGDDIDMRYPNKGDIVELVGFAKDGTTIREPRPIALRRPEIFLKMLREYLDTGTISEKLLQEPYYEKSFMEDDEESSWGATDTVFEANDVALLLKNSIASAEDFDYLRAIQVATTVHFKHNMRVQGVLAALDAKVEEIVMQEITHVDSPEQAKIVEEHITTFPFDDAEIAPRLLLIFNERGQDVTIEDASESTPNYEHLAAEVKTLQELAGIVSVVQSDAVLDEVAKIRIKKSFNTFAKHLAMLECQKNTSLKDFETTLRSAQNFPFSDQSYGLDVVDHINYHAKYFALKNIFDANSSQKLNSVAHEIAQFPFTKPNMLDLLSEISKKKTAHQRQKSGE